MRIRKYDYVTRNAMIEDEVTGGIHPYHEMLYIASGEVNLKWVETEYNASAPALFLLTPNTPHKLTVTSPQSSFGFLELELQAADYFPAYDEIIVWNEMQIGEDWNRHRPEHIFRNVTQLWDMLRSPIYSSKITTEIAMLDTKKILLLIVDFLENDAAEESDLRLSSEEAVHFLMRFMETDYRENITLKTLTQYVHLNTSYLIRLFHKVTGMTPLGYLQELRMNAATCFLSTTSMSVQEVAKAVGYQSIHYFSRLFKQKFGKSPTQWRIESQAGM